MTTTTFTPAHRELLWWLVIVALATALSLIWAVTPAEGSRPRTEPNQAPAATAEPGPWGAAVRAFRGGDLSVAASQLENAAATTAQPLAADCQVWLALADHSQHRYAEAAKRWHALALSPEQTAWKWLAVAVAELEEHHPLAVDAALAQAWRSAPDQPLVQYFQGLQQLERAAPWWNQRVTTPTEVAADPALADFQLLAAMAHFDQALLMAPQLDRQEVLAVEPAALSGDLQPTVADLMAAWGATHYEADAHHLLGQLHLQTGQLELAEDHLDHARLGGCAVAMAYEDLGQAFSQARRHRDAARVYAKTLLVPSAQAADLARMLHELRQATWGEWLR